MEPKCITVEVDTGNPYASRVLIDGEEVHVASLRLVLDTQRASVTMRLPSWGDADGEERRYFSHAPIDRGDLRCLGFVQAPSPDDSESVEVFAERMHEAWRRQKVANGFADHPMCPGVEMNASYDVLCAKCHMPVHKHHQNMRPYAELSEPVKDLDRAGAREFLCALAEWPGGAE